MRQLSAFQLVRAHSNGISRGLLSRVSSSRSYSIQEGECHQPVEGSFYRSQVDVGGKLFRFGVVVSSLSKGQSALPAWSQACSLLGSSGSCSPPTLAVAFVSKNTHFSAAAVEEIGKSFSEMIANGSGGAEPKFGVPLIGCVADLWTAGAPASTSPDGGERRVQGKRTAPESFKQGPVAQGSSSEKISGEVKAPGGDDSRKGGEAGVDSEEEDFKSLVGECARWTRENPGVVPDEENQALHSLDKQLKSSSSPGSLEKKPEEKKNEVLELENEAQQKKSKGVVSEMKSGRSPEKKINAEKLPVNETRSEELTSSETEVEQEDDDRIWMDIPVLDAREVAAAAAADVSSDRATSGEDMKFSSGVQSGIDDCFRMILCVAYMPGAKAVAFHSMTTGFPSLPDMESAILRSNPHMLLLGAPGYAFPEFIQRLAAIFTESVRAGAFLQPLYNGLKVVNASDSKPVFAGTRQLTSGIVGLSVSSSEGDGVVPVEAFTELIRMSFGMARVPGPSYFDDAVCNHLFFPENVSSDRKSNARLTPVDPSSLLTRLNSHLIRHSKVQSQSNAVAGAGAGAGAGASRNHESSAMVEDSTTSVEVKKSSDAQARAARRPNSKSESELQESSRSLPLALFDTVLFPGWSMPLHIYEPRYRHMVKRCIEKGEPFGVTSYWHWQNPDELFGTLATLKVYLFEKDCRSYVVADGVKRFRLQYDRMRVEPGTFGLNVGDVEFFDDNAYEENEELLSLARQVVDRCRQLIPQAEATAPGLVDSISNPTKASFAVGQLLPVPMRVKRRWLGMSDTKFRLLEQLTFMND